MGWTGLFWGCWFFFFFKILCIFERDGKGERKGRSKTLTKFCTTPTRDLACNPGMCPNQELSQWPVGLQARVQPTESHQPGQECVFLFFVFRFYLFLEREVKEKGRETSMCGCISWAPYWGPGPQPRHVPWLGMEPVTLSFAGRAQSTEPHQPGLLLLFLFSGSYIWEAV